MPYETRSDIGGLGRLAQAKLEVRKQRRLDVQQERAGKLADLQIEATQNNIREIERGREFKQVYMAALSQSKPGVRYNTGQDFLTKYARENPDDADLAFTAMEDLDKQQAELLDEIREDNPAEAARIANETIGKKYGYTTAYKGEHPEWGKMFTMVAADGTEKTFVPDASAPDGIRDITDLGKMKDEKAGEKEFEQATKLRKEFQKLSDDYMKVRDSYVRIVQSAQDPSAAGDLALIFNYMKVLDPGSVVRESEFATAQNAAGVPDRVRASYNRVLAGERLATGQRADFVDRAKRLYSGMEGQHGQRVNEYVRLAELSGVDPEAVITKMAPVVQTDATKPPEKIVDFDGQRLVATLSDDGAYYIERNGEFFKWVGGEE